MPVLISPSGELIKVHVPDAGNPLSITLPLELVQVGWVIVPMIGAGGDEETGLMTAFADSADVQPPSVVTSKL